MKNKIIVISVIYWSIVFLLTCIFIFYVIYTAEHNRYYISSNLTRSQSEEVKTLIGFTQFSSLDIINYKHKRVYGDDAIAHYTFDITISKDEHHALLEYIDQQANELLVYIQPCIRIYKDVFVSDKSKYEMQIDYIGQEGNEGPIKTYILDNTHEVVYANNVYLLISLLVLFSLSSILLYVIILRICFKKSISRN